MSTDQSPPKKTEPEKPSQPKEQTPAEVAAILRQGCENAGGEYITVKREQLLQALSLVK